MQQPGSITFGTPAIPASSAAPTFGATPSLFGTPSGFGATPGAAPAFNFGTQTTNAAPKFGSAVATPGLFGAAAPFGASTTTASTTGFNFGAQPAAPVSSAAAFSFGSQAVPVATTPSASFSFGPQTSAATAPSAAFSFGTPAATTTSAGLSFGTQVTSVSSGFPLTASTGTVSFGFNAPAATTQSTFGTAVTSSTGLSFGSTAGGVGFKGPTSTTGAPNFGTSTGLSFGTTSTAAPSLGFGLGGISSTPASIGALPPPFSLSTSSVGLAGLGTKPSNVVQTGTAAGTFVGLGGVRSSSDSQNMIGGTESAKNAENKAAKENRIPNEIQQLVENFKSHVKQQKSYSSDVARASIKPLRHVNEGIESLQKSMAEIENGLLSNRQKAAKLKFDTAKCLSHAEMAQRTHDTPPGFQFDNTAPLKYFIDTVNQFEVELNLIRQKIEVTGKHILSVEQPKVLTSQELTVGMRRLHETFIALAGRLQTVHARVESHKEQYLNFRKYVLKDDTDIFKRHSSPSIETIGNVKSFMPGMPKRAAGPTPFSSLGNAAYGFLSQVQPAARAPPAASPLAYPGTSPNTSGWSTPVDQTPKPPPYGVATGLSTSIVAPFNQSQQASDNFQLQKPPTGNKRGKH